MAELVHLWLKSNGADIQGEPTQTSMSRENTIECTYFESGVTTARETGSGMATGRRQHQPILMRKRVDKSSPLILKALRRNEVIEATWKFYRPTPAGDGTTQHFYTVKIEGGRVASAKQINPDSIHPATQSDPPMEEITFVFHTITWTYEIGGVTDTDNWSNQA